MSSKILDKIEEYKKEIKLLEDYLKYTHHSKKVDKLKRKIKSLQRDIHLFKEVIKKY